MYLLLQKKSEMRLRIEPMPNDNFPLYKIVFMEAKPYFAGDKTLDEVIEVIQNRATLYMNEK